MNRAGDSPSGVERSVWARECQERTSELAVNDSTSGRSRWVVFEGPPKNGTTREPRKPLFQNQRKIALAPCSILGCYWVAALDVNFLGIKGFSTKPTKVNLFAEGSTATKYCSRTNAEKA